MRKIILLLASLMVLPISTLANETPQMPTDAEIMQVIKTFNFTPEEQAYLFKETKKAQRTKTRNSCFSINFLKLKLKTLFSIIPILLVCII